MSTQLRNVQQTTDLANFVIYQQLEQAMLQSPEPRATILVIESDRVMGEYLQRHLETYGYRVLLAEEGATALSLFITQRVDLVLLDIELPQMDGFAICTALRQESEVPIIMLTPVEMLEYSGRAFQLGVDGCLTKPLVFSTVTQRIQVLLRTNSDFAYRDEALIH
jgi:DNA-binding response OmpR family regulator